MFCIVIEFIAVKLLFFVHSALIPGNKMQSSVEACCCLYLSSFHLSKFARHLVNHLLEAFLLLLFFFWIFQSKCIYERANEKDTICCSCIAMCTYFSLVILIDQLEIDFYFSISKCTFAFIKKCIRLKRIAVKIKEITNKRWWQAQEIHLNVVYVKHT